MCKDRKESIRSKFKLPSLLMNWISLLGLLTAAFAFITSGTLLVLDILSPFGTPYVGILTYMVGPGILAGGLGLTIVGALVQRARQRRAGSTAQGLPVIDLNNQKHLAYLMMTVAGGLVFISLTAVGSYRAYHFTESVEFCGLTCHKVMEPEHTAFQNSPHANVECTTCHIGPGAGWFVKAKLSGLRQVYNVAFNKYQRPISTPVHNLRPARETCYMCHWPQKFFGSVLLQRTYYRGNESNTPWTVQMLVKVGGGDREHGRAQGIHWHMAIQNKTEYIATDEKRLVIPWVRTTDANGRVTVFNTKDSKPALKDEDIAKAEIRVMDCIDCHNRPSHQYRSPERTMNEALASGRIDSSLSSIKAKACQALTGTYTNQADALASIQKNLSEAYPGGGPRVEQAIETVQMIYSENFFPEMNVNWKQYPDHIGHMITPGCFRCHDNEHVSDDGKVISKDCNSCHTIIAQGPGTELAGTTSAGMEFEHPEDIGDEWKKSLCNDCHEGMPVQ